MTFVKKLNAEQTWEMLVNIDFTKFCCPAFFPKELKANTYKTIYYQLYCMVVKLGLPKSRSLTANSGT